MVLRSEKEILSMVDNLQCLIDFGDLVGETTNTFQGFRNILWWVLKDPRGDIELIPSSTEEATTK